ncbi:MAG TPA: 3-phosphoshikimate 1-carboxyvinyltransferase [Pyrinomonadaceae bacterium]|jgi:3-phosphoshikimate 1-carboxyvinyltransferase|nr:3-phosphoshikimate 1-carboxyvinyltransferase [Pyrinomonadaceae bacterium]
MKVKTAKAVKGEIAPPGDKSISHRAAMFAAMAEGTMRIDNFATSADCASTISCLKVLGIEIEGSGLAFQLSGLGKKGFLPPRTALDCGNSGTTMRLMSGILAGQNFESTLTGDESLRSRPMKRIVDPLEKMGARFSHQDFRAPLTITGVNPLNAIDYDLPVASAQIKSAILLAGLNADGITSVIEHAKTRDHTERMLEWFGVETNKVPTGDGGTKISVSGESVLTARDITVPGDISSAAFFAVAAVCLSGSDLLLRNIGLNTSRSGVVDVLQDLGADVEIIDRLERCNEPVGDLRVTGRRDLGSISQLTVLKGAVIPNIIDEIPILAVLGTQLGGGLEIRDAAELRVKESDRIAAVVKNLRIMGAEVEEFPDGLRVGQSQLRGESIDSYGDHRIAMAFAVAGLLASGETEIIRAEAVDVSFPGFFDVLEGAVIR